ncbi:glycoside hydrolase family 3 N-terminal domain-containing protein [Dyadobacter sp. LHD-138]|uniref:glycoside hydrolase family 3 N-terminal domain-containing protein n=1 Tax=Dyadobacter sp. LHD-138 TaxID=3071413 RepID=UPI0027E13C27|nr:glycoside hydrolase family 3 N-terminal domain-containing protein [Dyadobacter sp. LHD-138]MDQ6482471.1 glycoside hydrolase family 3 N-terminal domain-containing protein [Dyadobacter sp. LHD-138]
MEKRLGSHLRVVAGVVILVVLSTAAVAWKLIKSSEPQAEVVVQPVVEKKVQHAPKKRQGPVVVLPEHQWVDSTLASLTLEEKIGQLFMVATFSNREESTTRFIDRLIDDFHLGGLIFFQGGPVRQAQLTNHYQARSKVPLFIGIDGEWGLGMRLDSTISFPKQMVLGAIQDDELIYRMGSDIGRQCRRLGIQINFAPVSDINSNANNPVIGVRSFGEDRENVTRKAVAYMKGLQHNGIIATAKHFPGHGDTDTDSHYTLPVLTHSVAQLTDVDLYPYRQLIADSLMGVLSGHLFIPALDNTPQLASSLSDKVINGLLRSQMGFRGLVFTDAMNMRGVLKTGRAAEVNLKALMAGNDVLLYPENVAETITKIKDALRQGTISQKFLDDKVKRILQAKYWSGLNQYKPIDINNLYNDLNREDSKELYRELCEASVTVVRNENNILPVASVTGSNMAAVTIGEGTSSAFQKMLANYKPIRPFTFYEEPTSQEQITEMLNYLQPYETVVVGIHGIASNPKRSYGVSTGSADFVRQLKQQGKKVILCLFGTPYSIQFFPETDALICANQDGTDQQEIVPQIIFGAIASQGRLPVSVLAYKAGDGIMTEPMDRISFGTPESVGVNGTMLKKIDEIANAAVNDHVFPGCQVVVARRGKIIYDKSFGGLSYKTVDRVNSETIYDVASVTKVAATLQSVMLLYDRKLIDLDERASHYLPELQATNKQNFTIRDLLMHRSGLVSFYPTLWDRTKTSAGGLLPEYYSSKSDSLYNLQVAPRLFAKPALRDSVWKWIVKSPMNNTRDKSGKYGYLYSDLGFLTLQKVIERISGQSLDNFITANIYEPLGLSYTGFNPLRRFPEKQIAPTEQDYRFRSQLIQGTVHDQMAAVVGGVSGHAGLFSTATDLAVLFQMDLWKGKYGGKQFFQPGTVPLFSRMYDEAHHRGLGWDKAPTDGNSSYVSPQASVNSFGHTGFTGAIVWVDPDEDLIFVFLSNRINPDAENTAITTQRTRRKIHDVVYTSLTERKSILH